MIAQVLQESRSSTNPRKTLRSRGLLVPAGGAGIDVRTVDITVGGLSVMANDHLVVGSRYALTFAIPRRGTLYILTAEIAVVYSTQSATQDVRVGLRFVMPDARRAELIAGLH